MFFNVHFTFYSPDEAPMTQCGKKGAKHVDLQQLDITLPKGVLLTRRG